MQPRYCFNKSKIILFISLFFLIFSKDINQIEFPSFSVVIDPGHGGFSLLPRIKHGDRYDSISKEFLTGYHAGTRYRAVEERKIVYDIAARVKNILDLTLKEEGFNQFNEILKKFSIDSPERIIIKSILSRGPSVDFAEAGNKDDPNSEYRLFDFVDPDGNKKPGRISLINSYKPHLVVSLHCDYQAPVYFRGINPVITAPYSLLYRGLNYLKGREKGRDFFFKSPYADWFAESVKRTGFKWFLKDVSVYFTGFPVDNNGKIEEKFSGYTYNMVTWQYKDDIGWENAAKYHHLNTQYAVKSKDFVPQGKFWDREKSRYESFKREGGKEGFGGDNLFASSEIIRYILLSLYKSGNYRASQKLGKPYISVWTLPALVNAITAYIELGYLKKKEDRFVLTVKQNEIAEGIAVGIYSLFAGMKPGDKFKYLPKGEKIDLKKYTLPSGQSYFDVVTQ